MAHGKVADKDVDLPPVLLVVIQLPPVAAQGVEGHVRRVAHGRQKVDQLLGALLVGDKVNIGVGALQRAVVGVGRMDFDGQPAQDPQKDLLSLCLFD